MYFIARRSISFLLKRFSGGWVGSRRRKFTKALFTFCCLHFSLLFVLDALLPIACLLVLVKRHLLLRIPSLSLT